MTERNPTLALLVANPSNTMRMPCGTRTTNRDVAAGAKLDARVARLPEHLRDAARRSWEAREEDYLYLADH